MDPPFPSPTRTWHNDVYSDIDPNNPKLKHNDETIIITGAGSGIGRETAIAFAAAGAKHIILVGRSESTLTETKQKIPNSTNCSIFPCDVINEEGIEKVAEAVGAWDVLILNAGYISTPAPVAKASVDEYMKNYETNVKSILIAAKAFFPSANLERKLGPPAVLAVTAGAVHLPTQMVVGLSGYLCSKLAQIKTIEFLAAENPNMFFASVHPGMIETKIFLGSGADKASLPMDTAQLPAHFMVWLTTSEGAFLNGRCVWANWDVKQLKEKAQTIESNNQMVLGYTGWPFAQTG